MPINSASASGSNVKFNWLVELILTNRLRCLKIGNPRNSQNGIFQQERKHEGSFRGRKEKVRVPRVFTQTQLQADYLAAFKSCPRYV
jgi:hypothetical protein